MDERTRSESQGRKSSSSGTGRTSGTPASQLKQIAKEKGLELRDRALGVVEERASERLGRAADGMSSFVNALRSAGDALGGPGSSRLAEYPIEMADRLQAFGEHLRESEPRELAREVEDLARRYPELFLGGVLLAGVATGRFLRASREELEREEEAAAAPAAKSSTRRRTKKSAAAAVEGDAPNYSGSRDYDEAEDGQYSTGRRSRGSADPGAGANYAANRDYADAGTGSKRAAGSRAASSKSKSKASSRSGTRSRVPAKAEPMPGGGRTARD